MPAAAVDAIPPGPARAIALAEAALREGAGAAAGALGAAGRALSPGREPTAGSAGPGTPVAIGAAFIEQAARVALTARDANAAAAYLAAARRLAPAEPGIPLAALGGAARATGRDAEKKLAEVLPALPAFSAVTEAVRRWGAGLARARGDFAAARAFLDQQPASLAAARDVIELDAALGAPLDPAALERARAGAGSPAAAATLTWVEAQSLRRQGQDGAASALLAAAVEAAPDATPLALIAEGMAADARDPAARALALETWLRGDDGRRAAAALLLAEARGQAGSELTARAALQTALEAAPTSAVFWEVAGEDARAGRRADASAVLAYGAEIWRGGALEAPLRACAAAKLAPADPARALEALELPGDRKLSPAARALGAEAVGRLAERAGQREALSAALDAATTAARDPSLRAWVELRHASSVPASDSGSRAIAFEEALRIAPAHPLALPIYLSERSVDTAGAAAALARAGHDGAIPAFARLASLAAVSLQALSGDHTSALRAAQDLLAGGGGNPVDREARAIALRCAVALGEPRGPAAAASLPLGGHDPERDDAQILAVAEARLITGDAAGARELFRTLASGRFAPDARRFDARSNGKTPPLPPELLAGPADAEAARAAAALGRLAAAAAANKWTELIDGLAESPPHEGAAGPATLAVAVALAESHDQPERAEQLAAAAARLATTGANAPRATLRDLGQVVGSAQTDPALRRWALTAAITALGAAESDRRAAASIWTARARVEEELGDPEAAAESRRAALRADPTFLPAARALRTTAARSGDVLATAAAAEVEASCLVLAQHRVRALLLAAALALEAQPPAQARALADLRAALAADPTHEAAFERLRSLLAEQGDARALAAALAARIDVAQNPFEVTSLRLARAELLARALGDPDGARRELEAVLRKQPEHPRALEALSELLWDRQEWAEAGEIFLRRAVVERDASTRCRIFLRLGQIYSTQVPDPKRAAAAYERALAVDEQNLEALRALSDLYLREGETKRALPVTERLVACEPDPARRHRTRVRLGEVLMQVGDLSRAGAELRRAFDEAPRDVEAVSALVQQLDRARDPAGRRGVLDRALGLLRHDLVRPGGLRAETLRALATLLVLRERPHAAHAAAQLLAAISGQRVPRGARPQPGGAAPAGARRARLPAGAPVGRASRAASAGRAAAAGGGGAGAAARAPRPHARRPAPARRAAATRVRRRRRGAGRRVVRPLRAPGGRGLGADPVARRAGRSAGDRRRRRAGGAGAGGAALCGGAHAASFRDASGPLAGGPGRGGRRAAGRHHPAVRPRLSARGGARRAGCGRDGAARPAAVSQAQAGSPCRTRWRARARSTCPRCWRRPGTARTRPACWRAPTCPRPCPWSSSCPRRWCPATEV